MGDFTKEELKDAIMAIVAIIGRAEKAREKFKAGTSWHTLQVNRINSLYVALSLVKKQLGECDIIESISIEELNNAIKPLASLLSKSEKAKGKLAQGTWQYNMLLDNIKALNIASYLLTKELKGCTDYASV